MIGIKAVITPFNWTEVAEGMLVSLIFVLAPLAWRLEKHHKQTMAAHKKTHDQLGIGEER